MTRKRPEALLSPCGTQSRRLDYDRYLCALFAPPPAREALFALLAFNSEIARARERVTEPMIGQIRLQWWREAIDGLYTGEARRHDVVEGLADAIPRYGLSHEHFYALIDAREFDMEERAPATLAELEGYAEETSSRLLFLWGEVLAPEAAAKHKTALRDVGIAWALIGLVRAAPFHAQDNRRYLPNDLMDEAGAREADYREMRNTPELAAVGRRIADCARARLSDARGRVARPPARLWPAFAPAVLAEDHLNQLQARDFALFGAPIQATGVRSQMRLMLARWRRRY